MPAGRSYQQGSFSTPVAKPPAGSSLLFGALADSGRIKERKNGSYRMVLKGVDEIDWFTDRPDRVAGEWSPKKLAKKWDSLFGGVEPNAQATFEVGSKRKLVTFEMFKPKLSDSNQTLSFKVRGIGEKNKDLLTDLRNKQLSDASLFIDGSLSACLPKCNGANLTDAYLAGALLADADLEGANLTDAYLTNASLNGAVLHGANLTDANLTNASLDGANLTEANLTGANLNGAGLLNAKLVGANLNYALLHGSNLTDANLTAAKGIGANLTDANLTGANLNGAGLLNANLSYSELSGANLSGAILDGSDLSDAKWFNTTCPDGTLNELNLPCTAEQLNLA